MYATDSANDAVRKDFLETEKSFSCLPINARVSHISVCDENVTYCNLFLFFIIYNQMNILIRKFSMKSNDTH